MANVLAEKSDSQQLKLGELMVRSGAITQEQCDALLKRQCGWGCAVGQIALSAGLINQQQLARLIAKQHGLDYADLADGPYNATLLHADLRQEYHDYGYVPIQEANGVFTLAIVTPSRMLTDYLNTRFGPHTQMVTSQDDLRMVLEKHFSDENSEDAQHALYHNIPELSAKHVFSQNHQRAGIFSGITKKPWLMCLLAFAIIAFPLTFVAITLFYSATLVYKLVLMATGALSRERHFRAWSSVNHTLPELDDAALPIYTLLIPLFKEREAIVQQLSEAVMAFDYPQSKLDVKLIVEGEDEQTQAIIKRLALPRCFEMIVVPHSQPQTKPKALNYALRYARGELATIYDAEDIPDPTQLKEAVRAFQLGGKQLACVQARLNYYNRDDNVLTQLFAMEYSTWFDFQLFGLQAMRIPIPLGGTSNHFRMDVLRSLYAWDPHNVTEDADLGIRLAAMGYHTRVLQSETMEEAPQQVASWIRQRSRWIKGHLQTYIVHAKSAKLLKDVGFMEFVGFLFFIGAPCLVFITLPFMLLAGGMHYLLETPFPAWFWSFAYWNLFGSLIIHALCAMLVFSYRGWWHMALAGFVFPFYWLLHSIASFKAVWQLITAPFYWEKTDHGDSLENAPAVSSPPSSSGH